MNQSPSKVRKGAYLPFVKSENSFKRHKLVWGNKQTAEALQELSKVKVLGFVTHTQDIFDVTSMFIL